MATERIQIIVSSKGTVTVKRDVEGIGDAAKRSTSGVDMLRSALAMLGTYLSVNKVIDYADGYTRLQNALKIAGLEGQRLAETQSTLANQANRNGVELESLARVYSRAAIAGKELGASEEELLEMTSGVAAALKVSGISANDARGPMLQLAQALGSPIVRAEEFNSILEGMLPIAQAAARGISGFEGSVSKLRTAVVNGEITNKAFFEGLLRGLSGLEAQADKASLTIRQSFQVLQNNMTLWIGGMSEGTLAASLLSTAILFVANNIDLLMLSLTPLIAAMLILAGQTGVGAVMLAFTSLNDFITAKLIPTVIKLNAFLWANPYLLVAAAVLAIVAAVIYWRKELGITDAHLKKVYDTGVAVFKAIKEVIVDLWEYTQPTLTNMWELWLQIWSVLKDDLWPILQQIWAFLKPSLEGWWMLLSRVLAIIWEIQKFMAGQWFQTIKLVFTTMLDWTNQVIDAIQTLIGLYQKAISAAKALMGMKGPGQGGGDGPGAGAGGGGAPGMRQGGQFMVGGSGAGTDKTPVRFNANRGERVTVETRKQQRTNDAASGGGVTDVKVPVQITNVFDPAMVPTANESASGQRSIINVIAANRDEITGLLGVA